MNRILFIPLFFVFFIRAGEIKIIKVADANLFLTSDSQWVKLADVVTNYIHGGDSIMQADAGKAVRWAEKNLKNWPMTMIVSGGCVGDTVIPVHLYKKYPLTQFYINAFWLEKGWGVYAPCDTMEEERLKAAAVRAQNERRGFWKPRRITGYNPYSRLRLSLWGNRDLLQEFKFPPPIGIGYRNSEFIKLYTSSDKSFYFNGSIQTGSYFYTMLWYLNMGPEMGFKQYYMRGYYGTLIYGSLQEGILGATGYYGLDAGFRTPVYKGVQWEFEFNMGVLQDIRIYVLSITMALPFRR